MSLCIFRAAPAPAQPKCKKPRLSVSNRPHPRFSSKAPVPAAPHAQRQRPFHTCPRVLAAARRTPSFSFSLLRQPCFHFASHLLPASPCKGTYPPGRTGFRSAAPPRAETRHPPHSPNAKSPGLPALPIHDARTLPSGLRLPVHPARTAAVPPHTDCTGPYSAQNNGVHRFASIPAFPCALRFPHVCPVFGVLHGFTAQNDTLPACINRARKKGRKAARRPPLRAAAFRPGTAKPRRAQLSGAGACAFQAVRCLCPARLF